MWTPICEPNASLKWSSGQTSRNELESRILQEHCSWPKSYLLRASCGHDLCVRDRDHGDWFASVPQLELYFTFKVSCSISSRCFWALENARSLTLSPGGLRLQSCSKYTVPRRQIWSFIFLGAKLLFSGCEVSSGNISLIFKKKFSSSK